MILWMHRLRDDEEGQTLVLGAVFGIILALCVLGTVNMGRAVYEKMQVQTACDNGAYSQAAVEARVLNLTAYTNRAMVVHYASIMAASAYLTWIHYAYAWINLFATILEAIPPISAAVSAVNQVLYDLMYIMDIAMALMTPVISAANIVLWALQEGAWLGLSLNRLSMIPPEAHSGDSNSDAYRPIWPNKIPAANQMVFAQARGNVTLGQSTLQSLLVLTNLSTNPTVQEARLHMIEIANSARSPWTAYGDRYSNPSYSPIARHFAWPASFACNASVGTVARTELGTWAPFTLMGAAKMGGEIYTGDRLQLSYHCSIFGFPVGGVVSLFSLTTLDQMIPIGAQSTWQGVQASGGVVATVLGWILSGATDTLVSDAQSSAPVHGVRIMWISPYVFFAPSTKAGPAGGVSAITTGLGNFGQPDVIFGLARQRADFNRNPQAFGGQFKNIIGGGTNAGEVDFSYNGNDWPTVPGLSGQHELHEGFNALCAAQTYYHRPGDWKEMPNFFNPLWAARLMPVMESNAGAADGLQTIPALKQFLLH